MGTFNLDRAEYNTHQLQDKVVRNGPPMPSEQAFCGTVYVRPFQAEEAFANCFIVASFVVQSLLLQLWGAFNRQDGVSLLE